MYQTCPRLVPLSQSYIKGTLVEYSKYYLREDNCAIYFLLLLFGSTNPIDHSIDAFVESNQSFDEFNTACLMASFLQLMQVFLTLFALMQILFCYSFTSLASTVKYFYLNNYCLISLLLLSHKESLPCFSSSMFFI